MTTTPATDQTPITRLERAGLRLVFSGPASWWVPLARIVGVRVEAASDTGETALAHAEDRAAAAVRWFAPGLVATTLALVALALWSPVELELMRPVMAIEFSAVEYYLELAGVPFWLVMFAASVGPIATGVAVGVMNAFVFGGIPLYLLRRCAAEAAPAVGVALAQGDEAFAEPQAVVYPRVAYAAERMLYPRRR